MSEFMKAAVSPSPTLDGIRAAASASTSHSSLPSSLSASLAISEKTMIAPWGDPPKVLRVQLPGNQHTTIQTPITSTMTEVFNQIASKRSLDPSQYIMRFLLDGNKLSPVEMNRTLESYEEIQYKLVVMKIGEEQIELPAELGAKSGTRRKSVFNTPSSKQVTVRVDTDTYFPKTVTDQAEIARKLNSNYQLSSSLQSSDLKFRGVGRALSVLLSGKKTVDRSSSLNPAMPSSPEKEEPDVTNIYNSEAFNSSPSPTSPLSTIAAYSDTLNTISIQNVTSGGESFPSLERGLEGSLSQQLSNSSSTAATLKRKLSTKLFKSSEKSKNSIVSSNNIEILEESSTSESDSNISKEYTGTESADSGEMKRSDSDDIRHITMKALQRSPGDIMHGGSISSRLGRKRTSSSSAGQSAQSTTLRRSMTRGRTRTVSEGAAIILEYGDSGSVDNASPSLPNLIPIQILLPAPDISNNFGVVASSSENQPTTLTYKVGPETALENLLRHVCRVKNLLYDMYTLEDTNGQVKIEMDRTVNYYVNNDKSVAAVKEFKIVKKAKTYNLLSIVEGEKEVMIMQNVGGKFMVMAASEERLIERITDSFDDATGSATEYDYDYLDQFLMTYRSFMKPPLLFDYLMARFNAELPPDASEEDVAFFNMNKGPTQHRAVQALGIWAENYWHDFALNSELRNDLGEFIDEICQFEEFKAAGNSIRETIERQTEAYEKLFNEQRLNNPNQRGKMMESMLMTLKPEVVAQQLCLYDWSLFHNIHAIEYLNQIWRKKEDDEDTTPSLDFFIARFDQESYWVATEICSVKDLKKRTAVLVQFIQIARLCLEYNNFFSAFSLTAGLGLRPVERLKKTWKNLPDDIQKKFDELTKLCDPSRNMKNYRDRLAGSKPPVVPFLPIYLKDLTFLNDGNESKVRGLINFDKLRMMAGRVKEITSTVNIDYNFHKDPTVLNYLKKPTVDRDLNKLKELSLECEPNK